MPSEASKKFDPTGLANAIYDVSDWKVASRVQPSLLSPQDSVVDAQFTATRKPTGVFMEIIIPLSLISIFAMSAGYVALEHLDVRVGISSTAMLTVMAYLYVVSDKLPDIAYMCWIHFYTGAPPPWPSRPRTPPSPAVHSHVLPIRLPRPHRGRGHPLPGPVGRVAQAGGEGASLRAAPGVRPVGLLPRAFPSLAAPACHVLTLYHPLLP